jgi:hypothetical protein
MSMTRLAKQVKFVKVAQKAKCAAILACSNLFQT